MDRRRRDRPWNQRAEGEEVTREPTYRGARGPEFQSRPARWADPLVAERRTVGETALYQDRIGNRITDRIAVLGCRTYFLAHITAVSTGTRPPSRWRALVLLLFGLVFAFRAHPAIGLWGQLAGVAVALVAFVWVCRLRVRHCLYISTTRGEVRALERRDKAHLDAIATALIDAISMRS